MSKPPTLWCFDPGRTTGVAQFDLHTQALLRYYEAPLWEGLEQTFTETDIIVYETVFFRSPAFDPIGLEVIGAIKYRAGLLGCHCVPQPPGVISGVQKWPVYQALLKGIPSRHCRDAVSHGLYYFYRCEKG